MTVAVFTVFFGKLAQLPSQGLPYPVFYFAVALRSECPESGRSLPHTVSLFSFDC